MGRRRPAVARCFSQRRSMQLAPDGPG